MSENKTREQIGIRQHSFDFEHMYLILSTFVWFWAKFVDFNNIC